MLDCIMVMQATVVGDWRLKMRSQIKARGNTVHL